jgi:hypothetical protein
LRVLDIIFHDGGLHCLTRDERILVYSPVFAKDMGARRWYGVALTAGPWLR